MSTDSFGRITSQGGRPIPEMGSTTPGIELSDSERPAVGLVPAPYLPAVRFDDHKRANIVLSAGCPVGLDNAGNMVPAGTPGGHVYTYSALDFTTNLAPTLKAEDGTAVAAAGNSTMASGLAEVSKMIRPIGVVSYNAFQFEGKTTVNAWGADYTIDHSNPAGFGVHNTMAQDLVAVTCDYVLQCPYVFGKNLLSPSVKVIDNNANEVAVLSATAKSFPFAHDELIADATVTANASGIVVSTGVSGSLTGVEIVFVSPACGQGDNGSIVGTVDGSISFTSGTLGLQMIVNSSVDAATAGVNVPFSTLSVKGDHIIYSNDTEKYAILRNRAGATFAVSAATFRLTLGDQIRPSDPVVCRLGKFVKFDQNRHDRDEIIGQCLRVDKSPVDKDFLAKVKTAYDRSANPAHRMAGSATRGVPQLLHLVTDGAQIIKATNKQLNSSALTGNTLTTPPLALVVINMTR